MNIHQRRGRGTECVEMAAECGILIVTVEY